MQISRAEGWISGQGQEEAYAQNGKDGYYKEKLQQARSFQVAH
jgi:hypothetical protein